MGMWVLAGLFVLAAGFAARTFARVFDASAGLLARAVCCALSVVWCIDAKRCMEDRLSHNMGIGSTSLPASPPCPNSSLDSETTLDNSQDIASPCACTGFLVILFHSNPHAATNAPHAMASAQ